MSLPASTESRRKQKILFTSVMGPYGLDSQSSRFKNPMSLLGNQVTRGQQYYTVRMCQRTFAFDLFGANLDADVAVLNFPTAPKLKKILAAGKWDRVGISAIIPNFKKLIETVDLIRSILPGVPMDIGGHITSDDEVLLELMQVLSEKSEPRETFHIWRPQFEERKLAELPRVPESWIATSRREGTGINFVKRDGLEYYASLPGVGVKSKDTLYMPLVDASFGKRVFGIPISSATAGLMIPDVGCPMACHFCATSHKFGGKFVQFLKSAEDLMTVANAHADRGRDEMFVMSENFSLDSRRALALLRLMEEQNRPHSYSVFSSANGLVKLGIENIVKLGYRFIWIGLEESSGTAFKKTHGLDLRELVDDLQSHGVEVLGSTIIGFEHQTRSDIEKEISHALSYNCVYNQFMLYMPAPGTAFWDEMKQAGKLKNEFPWEDLHGQAHQNWRHPKLGNDEIETLLDGAFSSDFEVLGPSLFRMIDVQYKGYVKTRHWSHDLVQMRRAQTKKMFFKYIPLLSAISADLRQLRHKVAHQAMELKENLIREIGLSGRFIEKCAGPFMRLALELEKRRHRNWIRKRRWPDPKTILTHYGAFDWSYAWGTPRPEAPPDLVGIPSGFLNRRSKL